MPRLIVCKNCTESDCTYCNMNILAVALERGYFNSLMGEQHTVQIDSELVPVRHGRWVKSEDADDGYCSICNCDMPMFREDWYEWKYSETPYCPNCGAKMDEVEDG